MKKMIFSLFLCIYALAFSIHTPLWLDPIKPYKFTVKPLQQDIVQKNPITIKSLHVEFDQKAQKRLQVLTQQIIAKNRYESL
jgi:hypothetical protein